MHLSRVEWLVLATGAFLFLTRLYGFLDPRGYRRRVDGVLALPARLMQAVGFAAIVVGFYFLYAVFRDVPGTDLACGAIGLCLILGGAFWLLPNVVRDFSQLLFFNANPLFVRFVCFLGGSVGGFFLWLVLKRHLKWLQ